MITWSALGEALNIHPAGGATQYTLHPPDSQPVRESYRTRVANIPVGHRIGVYSGGGLELNPGRPMWQQS